MIIKDIYLNGTSSSPMLIKGLSSPTRILLDSIAASEKPADAVFVTKYQKLIGELLSIFRSIREALPIFRSHTMSEIGFVMSCLTRI
jgi:hypothetical protein